jgi:hypothetical protein
MDEIQPAAEPDAIDKPSLLTSLDEREAALIEQQRAAQRAVVELGGRILEVRNFRAGILSAQPTPPQGEGNGAQKQTE